MKKTLCLLSIFTLSLMATNLNYKDFGEIGTLYEIKELNGDDIIRDGLRDLNISKIKQDYLQQFKEAFTSHLDTKESLKDEEITAVDYVEAKYPVYDLNHNAIVKQGDMIISEIPIGTSLNLCFIDYNAGNRITDYIVNKFGKECIYMVNNIDSREFAKKYDIKESYPLTTQNLVYLERFNIKTFPTKIYKKTKYITTTTINIPSLREKLRLHNEDF